MRVRLCALPSVVCAACVARAAVLCPCFGCHSWISGHSARNPLRYARVCPCIRGLVFIVVCCVLSPRCCARVDALASELQSVALVRLCRPVWAVKPLVTRQIWRVVTCFNNNVALFFAWQCLARSVYVLRSSIAALVGFQRVLDDPRDAVRVAFSFWYYYNSPRKWHCWPFIAIFMPC